MKVKKNIEILINNKTTVGMGLWGGNAIYVQFKRLEIRSRAMTDPASIFLRTLSPIFVSFVSFYPFSFFSPVGTSLRDLRGKCRACRCPIPD